MSFKTTAAHSSRIKKPNRKPPSLNRSTSSVFSSLPRRKPPSTTHSRSTSAPKPHPPTTTTSSYEDEEDLLTSHLPDHGLVHALATDLTLRDVPQAIQYIQTRMWDAVPEERSGMNSTRVAEVLNFRRRIPTVVTVGHVTALLRSGTAVEREVAELVRKGVIRKVVVGVGGSRRGRGGMGEVLVLGRDLEAVIEGSELEGEIKERFLGILRKNPAALRVGKGEFEKEEDILALIHAGFLTKAMDNWTTTDVFSRPGDGSRGTLTSLSSISRAASGSLAAVGGEGAVHAAGGSAGGGASTAASNGLEYSIAIPNMGSFLKLLDGARAHLTSLLSKAQFREMPESLLRQRWEGGSPADGDALSAARRNRGEFAGVLPGRTRKWKVFWGVSFEWVLGECVGAGVLEVFETGSVGRGVRLL